MSEPVRVSVFDPVTGETEVQDLAPDNYILLCGERCEVTHHQFYPKSGTHQLTIKTHRPVTHAEDGERA